MSNFVLAESSCTVFRDLPWLVFLLRLAFRFDVSGTMVGDFSFSLSPAFDGLLLVNGELIPGIERSYPGLAIEG